MDELNVTNKSDRSGKIYGAEYYGYRITRKISGSNMSRPFYITKPNGFILKSSSKRTRMFSDVDSAARAIDSELVK